ncbi:MAG: hypothetical protein HZB91_00005 [Elusimicrobia bacterium]|nr:hypothetical protein [Elusimicrobiota bacterium]
MVAGTFIGLPIDEKLLQVGNQSLNFLQDQSYLATVDRWYKIGFFAVGLTMAAAKYSQRCPRWLLVPLGVALWMASAVDFQLHYQAAWAKDLLCRYYSFSFAIALAAQLLAYEALDELWPPEAA